MQNVGKQTIALEREALAMLEGSIGDSFDQAVDLIALRADQHPGSRLIVSGMGKSGHIGAKMAATFASTGQPSFFVHPAESGHGDLGMVGHHDTLILLSYSGETKELQHICHYAARYHIPIIAITAGASSALAKLATIQLILPSAKEACPMGLAPTSSSTMTLALGDALAVALLTKRGFTRDDFFDFHPSGTLGQQLKRVEHVMHRDMPLVEAQTPLQQVIEIMTQYKFGCVGIVDQLNCLVGMITDGDLRRHVLDPVFLDQTAGDIMTKNPRVLIPSTLLNEAISLFESKSITMVFVVDQNHRPVGFVHFLDCLRQKAA